MKEISIEEGSAEMRDVLCHLREATLKEQEPLEPFYEGG
jgi:hypothetical protein